MVRTLVTLVLLVAAVHAKHVDFKDCATNGGEVKWVDVDPCDVEPCTFKPGMKVTVKGEVVTTSPATQPSLKIYVKVLGFWTQYPDLDTDACKYLTCPVAAGQTTPFEISLTTLDWLPPMKTQIKFELSDNDSKQLACAQADIVIS